MITRLTATALVLLGSLAIGVGSASSLANPFVVEAAKKAGGPYTDANQSVTIKEGKSKLLFWRVVDADGLAESVRFQQVVNGGNEDAYKITWYKGKKPKAKRKITQAVVGSGYEFQLKAKKTKYIVGKVKAKETDTVCLAGRASTDSSFSEQAQFFINGACAR